jgi:hypothetical protein
MSHYLGVILGTKLKPFVHKELLIITWEEKLFCAKRFLKYCADENNFPYKDICRKNSHYISVTLVTIWFSV